MYLCMEVGFTCHYFYFRSCKFTSDFECKALLPITYMEVNYNFHYTSIEHFHDSKLKHQMMWRGQVSMPSIGYASFGQEA